MNSSLRSILLLGAGLIVGAVGSALFQDSTPVVAGTAEAKVVAVQKELVQARTQIAKLSAEVPKHAPTLEERSRAAAAQIYADLMAGRPVDMDAVFAQFRPVLRDLSPIFDNVRRRDERKEHSRIATHMGEAYKLTPQNQEALKQWLGERAIQDAEAFRKIAFSDSSSFEDFIRASKYERPDRSLDQFMERTLSGQAKERFINDRLRERAARVENLANTRVNRINDAVQLDPTQEDKIFAIMARSSPDYDARMKMDGLGAYVADVKPGQYREAAIRSVLRPNQVTQYDAYRQRRYDEANREAAEIGLRLPKNWDLYEDW